MRSVLEVQEGGEGGGRGIIGSGWVMVGVGGGHGGGVGVANKEKGDAGGGLSRHYLRIGGREKSRYISGRDFERKVSWTSELEARARTGRARVDRGW